MAFQLYVVITAMLVGSCRPQFKAYPVHHIYGTDHTYFDDVILEDHAFIEELEKDFRTLSDTLRADDYKGYLMGMKHRFIRFHADLTKFRRECKSNFTAEFFEKDREEMDAMFEKNMVGLTNGFCLVLYTGERMQQVIWKIQNLGRLDQQKWISPKAMQARARMLIWFSIASFYFNLDRDVPEAHVNAFVSVLQYKTFKLVSENDMDGIKRLLINTGLPSLNEMRLITKGECAGKTFNWLTDVPCSWERFLIELDLLINIGKPKKVKKLSLSYDFKEKMKTQQLNNLLEGAISEVQGSLEDFNKQMKSVILNSFGSLGNYFATLADFDSNIASADITYIKDKLKEFDRKTYWLSWSLEEDLKMVAQTVIKSAKLDKTLGMVHFVGDTIMAVVRGFLNDAGGYVEIRESMKKAEEAATNLAKAETLTGLIRDASRLTDKIVVGFRKNEAFLFLTAKLLKQEKERQVKVMEISELDALRREFLSRYQDYSPAIDSNDVAKLGAYIIGHNYHGLYCHGHKFSRT